MLQGIVLLLCATQVLHITDGAPTIGDELVGNFQKNMDTVHGNLMAGMTNVIKPLADLIDKVPEALLGVNYANEGIIGRGKDEIEDIILRTAGLFNSGVKLGSTLFAAPLKLAGDGMMAMENMVEGKSLDTLKTASEHKMNKRDLENRNELKELIGSGFRAIQKIMSEQVNPGMLRNKKALRKAKLMNTMLQQVNKDMSEVMGMVAEAMNAIKQMIVKL